MVEVSIYQSNTNLTILTDALEKSALAFDQDRKAAHVREKASSVAHSPGSFIFHSNYQNAMTKN